MCVDLDERGRDGFFFNSAVFLKVSSHPLLKVVTTDGLKITKPQDHLSCATFHS